MAYNGYLLDTNIAIGMVAQEKDIINFIQQAATDKMKIYFSVVTECEFISGLKTSHEIHALKFLNSGRFIGVDSNIARTAGDLRREQRQKGRKVKTPDALIIATAIEQNLILVSRDHDMNFVESNYKIRSINP